MYNHDMFYNESSGLFEIQYEQNNSFLMADFTHKIMKAEWNGKIDRLTAKSILSKGTDLIEFELFDKILLNHKSLTEFSTGVRLWLKDDYLVNRASRIMYRVSKMAAVTAESPSGSFYADIVTAGFVKSFPALNLRTFKTEEEALRWLI